jgi:hypothetical protein
MYKYVVKMEGTSVSGDPISIENFQALFGILDTPNLAVIKSKGYLPYIKQAELISGSVSSGELDISKDRVLEKSEGASAVTLNDVDAGLMVKSIRTQKLSEVDWVVTKHIMTGEPLTEEFKAYCQALRDITDQPGYPHNVEWPENPVELPTLDPEA